LLSALPVQLNQTTVQTFYVIKMHHLINLFSDIKMEHLRAGVRLNYFQKFDKLLVEPRLNIRQQISTVFALKLEGEFKNQTATQIVDFEDFYRKKKMGNSLIISRFLLP
jgi:hypothetical protein